ncbi:methylated-DNA--[protein]-cysteine S-methyltransferase [Priestia taiwanensis]|uniref:Methylated-DNA--protein-cysteine methyltransferase n=1 Tax=Priestia taiwanensis TaxID=1347902 RepID=A0A917ETQ3_9BACI|nr:methylated-DNA--[protein]-cysteine S-methyltransferase [Priestia taiwanensis]MBM7364555.1 methylated-DNA-[protein]-cysteine S-methyltransferase [Priestia taiwanensis]GGE80580.1 methylated-DNA--protein-cysteine methyltransferase [Priestia taiwanensis]
MDNCSRMYYETPIGWLEVVGDEKGVEVVRFMDEEEEHQPVGESEAVAQCITQLDEYFKGSRQTFTIPLIQSSGTVFQQQVWKALETIPYGEIVSYLDIAQKIGNEKAVRAIGGANSRNPIAIIVPCHRVIGKSGKLVGYEGGLWRKEYLLKLEGYLS